MEKKVLGLIVSRENVEKHTARFMIEYAINNPDNDLMIEDGYHIDKMIQLNQLNQSDIINIDVLVDSWCYAVTWDRESVEERFKFINEIISMDNAKPDDYFIIVSLYKDDLSSEEELNLCRDFAFDIRPSEAYISFLAKEDELNGDLSFVAEELIQTFDLFENSNRKRWFVSMIGLSNITHKDICSYITGRIKTEVQIEKRFDYNYKGNDRIKVTVATDPVLVKYLISLL